MREVRGKYKRTVLGHGWSLINPLATILIYTVVFGYLLRISAEPGDPSGVNVFALWLTCGLLPWAFFANTLTSGMGSLVANANLLQKVYFPREMLVASVVFSWDVSFLIELGVLAVVALLAGAFVIPWLPLVLLFSAMLTLFSLGLSLLLSVANVYFRDMQHLLGVLLQLWFFMTPIVYPISYVEAQELRLAERGLDIPLVFLFRLNPMARFVEVFRNLLYDSRWPTLGDSLFCLSVTAVALVTGYLVFKHFEPRLAEEL